MAEKSLKGIFHYLNNYEELEESADDSSMEDEVQKLISQVFAPPREPLWYYKIDPVLGPVMVYAEPVEFNFPAE